MKGAVSLTVKIDGADIVPFIAFGGVKWQREDVDGPNAGRMLDGELRRERIATKRRLDITCRPLSLSECSTVLTAIMPEFVTVTYTDPQLGEDVTKTMYSNNNPATFLMIRPDGSEWWTGITFPLIEK